MVDANSAFTEQPPPDKSSRPPCPEATANPISRIFLSWVLPLVYKGWKEPLQDDDIWELRDSERGQNTSAAFIAEWDRIAKEGKRKNSHRILTALFHNYRFSLLITAVLQVVVTVLVLTSPVLINRILSFLASDDPVIVGVGLAAALFGVSFLRTFVEAQFYFRTYRGGMAIRSGLQGALYHKSLCMSSSARASSSIGEIVNLMQLDTQRVGDSYHMVHNLWAAPVQIICSVVLLYNYIGVSSIIGFVVTFTSIPLQGWILATVVSIRKKAMKVTDHRVKLMNEILQGIKAVKFYAWEQPFIEAVGKERTEEISFLKKTIWARSAFVTLLSVIPVLVGVVTFTFYSAVFGERLDPARVFTAVALLNQLRIPIMQLPMSINLLIDAGISIKRLESFLDLEETDNYSRKGLGTSSEDGSWSQSEVLPKWSNGVLPSSASENSTSASIVIRDGEFEWSRIVTDVDAQKKGNFISRCLPKRKKARQTPPSDNAKDERPSRTPSALTQYTSLRGSVLSDISIEMKGGEFIAIVGRVGSGKSSLLNAILGEMRKVQGSVTLEGAVAYVAQTAWIFNDTLRNNITFGKEFDEKLYMEALRVSALHHDINILPNGDLTSIGEKGINLSGGQKQRVSIARAVYADADIVLFDDPLSALDAHVGQEVFDKCISKKGVLRSKLRVLVTNQVHLLPECDKIIFLEGGCVRGQGKYSSLIASDESFRQLISEQRKLLKEEEEEEEEKDRTPAGDGLPNDASIHSSHTIPCSVSTTHESKRLGEKNQDGEQELIQSEERTTGNVAARTYYKFVMSCGGVFMFSFNMLFWCLSVAVSVLVQWWLSYWAEQDGLQTTRSTGFFLGIYFGLAALYTLMFLVRSVWFLRLTLYASKKAHNKMLRSVLRAPMSFFDTTPIGRIISRFSRDVNALDLLLPQAFQMVLSTVLQLIAAYVFIGTVTPTFLIAAVPVTFLYGAFQRFFNRTSLELKRLDSISKSPIYANFSETLGGLSTLRAYNKQSQSCQDNMELIDVNQRAYFSFIACNRWFSLFLEIAGSLLIFAAAMSGVFSRGSVFRGDIGLSLTYALQVTAFLGYTIRSITDLEGQMNSVERANYYCNKLPKEAPTDIDPKDGEGAPDEWPMEGNVDIKNVEMRYRDGLDLVLKGVNVSIAGGEKVGIVGRTGSGKSSLVGTILRMVEVSSGQIIIDGLDVQKLGLNDVRKRITIIPQDPVMFSGTIRFNLDPLQEQSDAALWDALEKTHMREFVSTYEEGLDAMVSEYGENISAGQRQVLCLTRALLRNSKVVILDEASSSLDMETDKLIQETIRKYLKHATIITIAHRLFSLVDYDKIMVMDEGVVAEFGTPDELLKTENGKFSELVEAMGPLSASHFKELVCAADARKP